MLVVQPLSYSRQPAFAQTSDRHVFLPQLPIDAPVKIEVITSQSQESAEDNRGSQDSKSS